MSESNTCNKSDFLSLKLLNFHNICEYFSLIRFFKYYKNEQHNSFKLKYECCKIIHRYLTRNANASNLNYPSISLSKLKSSFYFNSIKYWNSVPLEAKSIERLDMFKRYLKTSHKYSDT